MKKILTVILILVMLLTLFACTKQATQSGTIILPEPSSGGTSGSDPATEDGGASDEGLVADPTDGEPSAEGGAVVIPSDGSGSLPYSHKDSIGGGAYGGLIDGGIVGGGVLTPRTPAGGGVSDYISGSDVLSGGESKESSTTSNYKAGQITAKARNDNDHYEEWVALFAEATDNEAAGKFSVYRDGLWAFDTSMRVTVHVTQYGEPVVGAYVEYYDEQQNLWTCRTNVSGVAYLFPPEESGSVKVKSGDCSDTVAFSKDERDLNVELDGGDKQANIIKVMFVIDATGSMGDEMHYIAAELADVIHRVSEQATPLRIDLSLLFYRDDGDKEKFAFHDFVTVTDDEETLAAQVEILTKQRASGGGDYAEAVDEALLMAVNADWGEENSTNLIVLVLDAPPHKNQAQLERTALALQIATEKGIRICPVLCSGADTFCEYVTRTSALITGGTSIFVTDHSGIGGAHLDPDLPEETVEHLNDLLVRVIVGYHTGDFGTPVAWDQQSTEQQ